MEKLNLLEQLIVKLTTETLTALGSDKIQDSIEALFVTFDVERLSVGSFELVTDGTFLTIEGYRSWPMERTVKVFETNALGPEDVAQISTWQGPEDGAPSSDGLHNQARSDVRADSSEEWHRENFGRPLVQDGGYDGAPTPEKLTLEIDSRTERMIIEGAMITTRKFRVPVIVYLQDQISYLTEPDQAQLKSELEVMMQKSSGFVVCGIQYSFSEGEIFASRKAVTHVETIDGQVIRDFTVEFWQKKVAIGRQVIAHFGKSDSCVDIALRVFNEVTVLDIPTVRLHNLVDVHQPWEACEVPIVSCKIHKEMYEFNGDVVESTNMLYVHEVISKYDLLVSKQSMAQKGESIGHRVNRMRNSARMLQGAAESQDVVQKWIVDPASAIGETIVMKPGTIGNFYPSYFELPGEMTDDGHPVSLWLPRLEAVNAEKSDKLMEVAREIF